MLISICAHAQIFMGVSVSGTTTEFANQLKPKGFVLSSESTPTLIVMTGNLGGESVELLIAGTPKTHMTAKLVFIYPKEETWHSLLGDYNKVKKIIRKELSPEDYKLYGLDLTDALFVTGADLTEEETQTLVEAANV